MNKNIIKAYSYIGKFLCAVAGSIVGFVCFGIAPAVFGFFLGGLIGHLLEKAVVNPKTQS